MSFFGPFYGGYHVIALDQLHYHWAMVVGPNRQYLWILASDKILDVDTRDRLLARADSLGFNTNQLVWVASMSHATVFGGIL